MAIARLERVRRRARRARPEPVAPEKGFNWARLREQYPLPVYWPLWALVVLYPLWWILGLASLMPIVVAVPMIAQLRHRHPIYLPRGSGWWLAFLLWVGLSAFGLFSDAPWAVSGGSVANRSLIWVYYLLLYLACTVAFLWVANLSRQELSFPKLAWILSLLYVYATFGGLLGLVLPNLQLSSALELILPGPIASNSFVQSLIHPSVADLQTILGYTQARPKAPFAYANTWGSVVALSIPFFVLAWFTWGGRIKRVLGVAILLVSAIPIVYSLNRGLWACLALGVGYLIVMLARRGQLRAFVVSVVVLVAAAVIFVVSPLGDMVGERLRHQHSNDRREQLLVQTVESAAIGSPVIGFGGTRDVQGSFASIAGGSTAECPSCGVPPLGTQGHLWLVIFAQGLIAVVFFVMFFLAALWRGVLGRSLAEQTSGAVALFFLLQMFVYDTIGLPLMIVLIAVAAGWREAAELNRAESITSLASDLGRHWRSIVLLMAVGGVVGAAASFTSAPVYSASESVLLSDTPSYLPLDSQGRGPRRITIDTEAALVVSEQTLLPVSDPAVGTSELRSRLEVTAIPNTRILVITLRGQNPDDLRAQLSAVTTAYLSTRADYLSSRRQELLASLYARQAELVALGKSPTSAEVVAVQDAIDQNLVTPTRAGESVRVTEPEAVRRDSLRYLGSGVALGLLAGGVLVASRPRRLTPLK